VARDDCENTYSAIEDKCLITTIIIILQNALNSQALTVTTNNLVNHFTAEIICF